MRSISKRKVRRYERGMAIIWVISTHVHSFVLDLISTWKNTSYDHGYVPLVVTTPPSFPHSRLITGFTTRLTLRVSLVQQELLTHLEHLSSPPVVSEVRVTRSSVLCVSFVDRCFSFSRFSFGHCIVYSSYNYSSIHRFIIFYLKHLFYYISSH